MPKSFKTFIDTLWKFFSSIQLAIVLILVLVSLSLIGTLVIQVPPEYKANLQTYNLWLQNIAQPKTGFWYPLLKFGDLFDVFHSSWFLGTGILLIINIVVCSLNRLKPMFSAISRSPIINRDTFYYSSNTALELTDIQENAESVNILSKILRKRGYSVRIENSAGGIYLAADKNRFAPLGTYLIHLSVILFIAGYLVGNAFGFRNTSFVVPEQSTREIGNGTGLSVRLNSFVDEYWPDGSPKEYRSDVVIYQNGGEVKTGIVRVNHPLSYNGVNIYQSFFGPAIKMQIASADGDTLFAGNIALDVTIPDHPYQRSAGELTLSQEGYRVLIMGGVTNADDTILKNNRVKVDIYQSGSTIPIISTILDEGVPYNTEGLNITYLGKSYFSGFEISRDPGINVIWTASVLLMLGLLAIFYFPRRKIWALLADHGNNGKGFMIRTDSDKKFGAVSELKSLVSAYEREIVPEKRK